MLLEDVTESSGEGSRCQSRDSTVISMEGFFSCHLPDPDRDAARGDQEGDQEKNNGDHPLLLAGQVQPRHRDYVPLFTSGETIQWVVGLRIGHPGRCRVGTRRVLVVRARSPE